MFSSEVLLAIAIGDSSICCVVFGYYWVRYRYRFHSLTRYLGCLPSADNHIPNLKPHSYFSFNGISRKKPACKEREKPFWRKLFSALDWIKNSHLNRLDLRDRPRNHLPAERILEMKVELKKMYLFASPYEGTILKLWGKKSTLQEGAYIKLHQNINSYFGCNLLHAWCS